MINNQQKNSIVSVGGRPVGISINLNEKANAMSLVCHYIPYKLIKEHCAVFHEMADSYTPLEHSEPETKEEFYKSEYENMVKAGLKEKIDYMIASGYPAPDVLHLILNPDQIDYKLQLAPKAHVLKVTGLDTFEQMKKSKSYTKDFIFSQDGFAPIVLNKVGLSEDTFKSDNFANDIAGKIIVTKVSKDIYQLSEEEAAIIDSELPEVEAVKDDRTAEEYARDFSKKYDIDLAEQTMETTALRKDLIDSE